MYSVSGGDPCVLHDVLAYCHAVIIDNAKVVSIDPCASILSLIENGAHLIYGYGASNL